MYEEEILKELKRMNDKLDILLKVFHTDESYGGCDFRDCLTRIMYGVEE